MLEEIVIKIEKSRIIITIGRYGIVLDESLQVIGAHCEGFNDDSVTEPYKS